VRPILHPTPRDAAPFFCAVCGGKTELVYDRSEQQLWVCTDCHCGLTIPAVAWKVQKAKRGRNPKT
jgi:ribosomal protein L37AE/L43A